LIHFLNCLTPPESILTTILNNIVLTVSKTGGVDDFVVQLDDDSVTSDDQHSNAEHDNGADGEEDDVDEADKEEDEE
jgi:hypothetical protein